MPLHPDSGRRPRLHEAQLERPRLEQLPDVVVLALVHDVERPLELRLTEQLRLPGLRRPLDDLPGRFAPIERIGQPPQHRSALAVLVIELVVAFVVTNVVVDIAYALLDPRVSLGSRAQ